MDNMRALVNFAILNANRRNGKNYLDSLVPFVEELFIRKNYEEVNIDRICQDFKSEFLFRIPIHPMKVVLKRLVRAGKLTYCHNNIWKRKQMSEQAILKTRKEYEEKYAKVLEAFTKFIKSKFNETIGNQSANDALIAFLEKQDVNLLFFAKKDLKLFPETRFEIRTIKRLALFLEKEAEKNTEIFQYIVEIASGHILASTIVNEEKQPHEERIQKVKIYCDTAHILKILGLSGEIQQKMVEDLFKVFVEAKCHMVLFRHTYDEILHNINNAKKWFSSPNCDLSKASRTTLYFIENDFTDLDVDRVLNNVDVQLKKFNIKIEEAGYNTTSNESQIGEEKLREIIINEYKTSNEEFDENNSRILLDNDVRSIAMIYRKLNKHFPIRFKDLQIVFLCANSSLAKACRIYHLTVEEPNKDKFIPFCVTDIFLGTYMWLQSPQEIDKLAKKKIIAEVYSVLQPTDAMIRKYLIEIQDQYKKNEISEDEYALLRASSVINEILPESADTVEQITRKTSTDMLERIKSQSKEEGLRKFYAERSRREKIEREFEEEKEKQKIKKNKKKQSILKTLSLIFDILVAVIIFCLSALMTFLANWITIVIIGLVSLLSFWGICRGHDFYENKKNKIISPLADKLFNKFWGDL